MRRKEKEVRDIAAIESVIRNSLVCRLGLARNNQPYVVPLCFGYSGNTLYFHSSPRGKKIDMLKTNGDVCFEFDIDHEVVQDVKPCKWTMNYRSVIGYGRATLVEDLAEKKKGLDIIITHAPPRHIHDGEDQCHRGFECFLNLIERYAPRYFIHGHMHFNYTENAQRITVVNKTKVINSYGHYLFEINVDPLVQ